jgi:hypothetical protein
MKEVSLHYKSIVECMDEEEDDLVRILAIKKEVIENMTKQLPAETITPRKATNNNSNNSNLSNRASNFLRSFWR